MAELSARPINSVTGYEYEFLLFGSRTSPRRVGESIDSWNLKIDASGGEPFYDANGSPYYLYRAEGLEPDFHINNIGEVTGTVVAETNVHRLAYIYVTDSAGAEVSIEFGLGPFRGHLQHMDIDPANLVLDSGYIGQTPAQRPPNARDTIQIDLSQIKNGSGSYSVQITENLETYTTVPGGVSLITGEFYESTTNQRTDLIRIPDDFYLTIEGITSFYIKTYTAESTSTALPQFFVYVVQGNFFHEVLSTYNYHVVNLPEAAQYMVIDFAATTEHQILVSDSVPLSGLGISYEVDANNMLTISRDFSAPGVVPYTATGHEMLTIADNSLGGETISYPLTIGGVYDKLKWNIYGSTDNSNDTIYIDLNDLTFTAEEALEGKDVTISLVKNSDFQKDPLAASLLDGLGITLEEFQSGSYSAALLDLITNDHVSFWNSWARKNGVAEASNISDLVSKISTILNNTGYITNGIPPYTISIQDSSSNIKKDIFPFEIVQKEDGRDFDPTKIVLKAHMSAFDHTPENCKIVLMDGWGQTATRVFPTKVYPQTPLIASFVNSPENASMYGILNGRTTFTSYPFLVISGEGQSNYTVSWKDTPTKLGNCTIGSYSPTGQDRTYWTINSASAINFAAETEDFPWQNIDIADHIVIKKNGVITNELVPKQSFVIPAVENRAQLRAGTLTVRNSYWGEDFPGFVVSGATVYDPIPQLSIQGNKLTYVASLNTAVDGSYDIGTLGLSVAQDSGKIVGTFVDTVTLTEPVSIKVTGYWGKKESVKVELGGFDNNHAEVASTNTVRTPLLKVNSSSDHYIFDSSKYQFIVLCYNNSRSYLGTVGSFSSHNDIPADFATSTSSSTNPLIVNTSYIRFAIQKRDTSDFTDSDLETINVMYVSGVENLATTTGNNSVQKIRTAAYSVVKDFTLSSLTKRLTCNTNGFIIPRITSSNISTAKNTGWNFSSEMTVSGGLPNYTWSIPSNSTASTYFTLTNNILKLKSDYNINNTTLPMNLTFQVTDQLGNLLTIKLSWLGVGAALTALTATHSNVYIAKGNVGDDFPKWGYANDNMNIGPNVLIDLLDCISGGTLGIAGTTASAAKQVVRNIGAYSFEWREEVSADNYALVPVADDDLHPFRFDRRAGRFGGQCNIESAPRKYRIKVKDTLTNEEVFVYIHTHAVLGDFFWSMEETDIMDSGSHSGSITNINQYLTGYDENVTLSLLNPLSISGLTFTNNTLTWQGSSALPDETYATIKAIKYNDASTEQLLRVYIGTLTLRYSNDNVDTGVFSVNWSTTPAVMSVLKTNINAVNVFSDLRQLVTGGKKPLSYSLTYSTAFTDSWSKNSGSIYILSEEDELTGITRYDLEVTSTADIVDAITAANGPTLTVTDSSSPATSVTFKIGLGKVTKLLEQVVDVLSGNSLRVQGLPIYSSKQIYIPLDDTAIGYPYSTNMNQKWNIADNRGIDFGNWQSGGTTHFPWYYFNLVNAIRPQKEKMVIFINYRDVNNGAGGGGHGSGLLNFAFATRGDDRPTDATYTQLTSPAISGLNADAAQDIQYVTSDTRDGREECYLGLQLQQSPEDIHYLPYMTVYAIKLEDLEELGNDWTDKLQYITQMFSDYGATTATDATLRAQIEQLHIVKFDVVFARYLTYKDAGRHYNTQTGWAWENKGQNEIKLKGIGQKTHTIDAAFLLKGFGSSVVFDFSQDGTSVDSNAYTFGCEQPAVWASLPISSNSSTIILGVNNTTGAARITQNLDATKQRLPVLPWAFFKFKIYKNGSLFNETYVRTEIIPDPTTGEPQILDEE